MNYVMADLHGHADEFKEMLNRISFNKNDTLYILGDVIDRGKQSLECLRMISLYENIVPILGNHEYMAMQCLPKLLLEIREDNINKTLNASFLNNVNVWMQNGGNTTINEFRALTRDDQQFYLEMMEDFSLYEEVTIGDKDYYLTHTLPEMFNPDKEYTIEEYLFSRPDFACGIDMDETVVMGHTPTAFLGKEYKGKIYKNKNIINVDCGCAGDIVLGCLCLETMEEFYVECK